MSVLDEYKTKMIRLREVRDTNPNSPEEDELTDALEKLWWKLDEEEQEEISSL